VTPLQRLPAGAALEALPGVLPCLATSGRPSRALRVGRIVGRLAFSYRLA